VTTVIFDFDGVLADSRAAIGETINYTLAAHGLATLADTRPWIGPPLLFSFAGALGVAPDSADAHAMLGTYRRRYEEIMVEQTTSFPGVPEAVRRIARSHPLAVCSSKPTEYSVPLLEHLGLRGYFGYVGGPTLQTPDEEKTATLARVLEHVDTPATMVGDRSNDVVAAHAHGLRCVGVLWGFGTAEELARADALIETPAQLADAVIDRG
jgi:phosphoglycolate phosphatase